MQPTLLLIHGLASNRSRFEEFAETTTLSQTHRIFRVDLPGHGDALTRRRINLEIWCDTLAEMLNRQAGAPTIVIGHSLGAQVALHLAQRHPSCVRGLVLIDPVFREALRGKKVLWAWCSPLLALAAAVVRGANAVGLYRRQLPPLDLRWLDRQARIALQDPQAQAAFIRQYSSAWADLRHVPLAVYLQDTVEMLRPSPRPSTLGVPVLALMSSGATFADAKAMRDALAGPQVQIQVIHCHHWPLTEQPDAVRQAVENWCQDLAARRSG